MTPAYRTRQLAGPRHRRRSTDQSSRLRQGGPVRCPWLNEINSQAETGSNSSGSITQRPKVLFTSGINTAVDDLVPRFMSIVKTILGKLGLDLICLRMHSYKVKAKDFPRLTAKLGREIEQENNDVTSSFLIRLLSKFSGEVDAFEREGRKNSPGGDPTLPSSTRQSSYTTLTKRDPKRHHCGVYQLRSTLEVGLVR